jgi:hypothetical protein
MARPFTLATKLLRRSHDKDTIPKPILLSRDAFREGVFTRDSHHCVACSTTEGHFDAHHIIERRLWPDDGYWLGRLGVVVWMLLASESWIRRRLHRSRPQSPTLNTEMLCSSQKTPD